ALDKDANHSLGKKLGSFRKEGLVLAFFFREEDRGNLVCGGRVRYVARYVPTSGTLVKRVQVNDLLILAPYPIKNAQEFIFTVIDERSVSYSFSHSRQRGLKQEAQHGCFAASGSAGCKKMGCCYSGWQT